MQRSVLEGVNKKNKLGRKGKARSQATRTVGACDYDGFDITAIVSFTQMVEKALQDCKDLGDPC